MEYTCASYLLLKLIPNHSTYLGYFDQLIMIIMPVEEWLLAENLYNTISTKESITYLGTISNFDPSCNLPSTDEYANRPKSSCLWHHYGHKSKILNVGHKTYNRPGMKVTKK